MYGPNPGKKRMGSGLKYKECFVKIMANAEIMGDPKIAPRIGKTRMINNIIL